LDSEPVTVKLTDLRGDLVSGSHTANLELNNGDDGVLEVSLKDGVGTVDVTTSEPAGSYLPVQAVAVDGLNDNRLTASKKKAINVV